jgi:hypothetical protein
LLPDREGIQFGQGCRGQFVVMIAIAQVIRRMAVSFYRRTAGHDD